MPTLVRNAAMALVAVWAILCGPVSRADTVPAAAQFYAFLGTWHGHGRLAVAGQRPVKLTLTVSCRKAAAGWAVQCAMHGWNKRMAMSEADLMAVDTATGKARWYGVTNQGEAYVFLVTWPRPHTMHAHYAWTQHGRRMQENVVFKFSGKRTLSWRSVDTVNGHQQVSTFTGTVVRQ